MPRTKNTAAAFDADSRRYSRVNAVPSGEDVYLFPTLRHCMDRLHNFDHHRKACRKEADITDFHFHDLLHLRLPSAKNGATLLEIANHLGQ